MHYICIWHGEDAERERRKSPAPVVAVAVVATNSGFKGEIIQGKQNPSNQTA